MGLFTNRCAVAVGNCDGRSYARTAPTAPMQPADHGAGGRDEHDGRQKRPMIVAEVLRPQSEIGSAIWPCFDRPTRTGKSLYDGVFDLGS